MVETDISVILGKLVACDNDHIAKFTPKQFSILAQSSYTFTLTAGKTYLFFITASSDSRLGVLYVRATPSYCGIAELYKGSDLSISNTNTGPSFTVTNGHSTLSVNVFVFSISDMA